MTQNPLKMSAELVRSSVVESVAGSGHPATVKEQFFEECLQLPVAGLVTVDDFHAKNLGVLAGPHWVWFITLSDPQSVFFDESSGPFGSCWGQDRDSGGYDDFGFRGQNPIEIYLL